MNVPELMEVRFSFLTSGPTFRLLLPTAFEHLPELSSPLDAGAGGRSYVFIPAHRDPGIREETVVLGMLTDRDGRPVELHERVGEPRQWYLRWRLSSGWLYTHLREEDGVNLAEVVVASLSIVEDPVANIPFLLPEPPLSTAVTADPGYQEFATFLRTDERWGVTLMRPGYVPPGEVIVGVR